MKLCYNEFDKSEFTEAAQMKTKAKKIITVAAFLSFITCTMVLSITGAIQSYNYDFNHNIDILEGFGAVLCLMIGGFLVFYETDLLYTVYYFLFKPKTKAKTVLNLLSDLSLVLIIIYTYLIEEYMNFRKYESPYLVLILLLLYTILRFIYIAVCLNQHEKENQ